MRVSFISIFPDQLRSYCGFGVISKAQQVGALELSFIDPRDYTHDLHRSVDDAPYGGGPGMLMKCEPIVEAIEANDVARPVVLLTPGGERLSQSKIRELASLEGFTLLCGRYEGVDARVEELVVDMRISLGDYVLAGGELAALCVLEAVSRLLPEVLGNENSPAQDSFEDGLLEYAQYTRPAEFRGIRVPGVLLGGNHQEIERWRRRSSLLRTASWRPDLLKREVLSEEDVQFLAENGYSVEVDLIPSTSED
jgi:tRNA (guanine37-N1)-methyltransferase